MHNNKDQISVLEQQWLKMRNLCQYFCQVRLSEVFSPPGRLQAFGLKHTLVESQPLLQPQCLTFVLFFSHPVQSYLAKIHCNTST